MSRRELREHIFKMVFRIEFYPDSEMNEQLKVFLEENEPMDEADETYIRQKYEAIKEKLAKIDETINTHTTGWKTDRMGKAELAIIRLAVYEMLYDEEVPTSVAINEAVELAKKYGTDEAPSFVNGVLAKIA